MKLEQLVTRGKRIVAGLAIAAAAYGCGNPAGGSGGSGDDGGISKPNININVQYPNAGNDHGSNGTVEYIVTCGYNNVPCSSPMDLEINGSYAGPISHIQSYTTNIVPGVNSAKASYDGASHQVSFTSDDRATAQDKIQPVIDQVGNHVGYVRNAPWVCVDTEGCNDAVGEKVMDVDFWIGPESGGGAAILYVPIGSPSREADRDTLEGVGIPTLLLNGTPENFNSDEVLNFGSLGWAWSQ